MCLWLWGGKIITTDDTAVVKGFVKLWLGLRKLLWRPKEIAEREPVWIFSPNSCVVEEIMGKWNHLNYQNIILKLKKYFDDFFWMCMFYKKCSCVDWPTFFFSILLMTETLSEIVFELVQVLPSVYLLFTRKYCIWNYLSVMSFVIILIEV